MGLLNFLNDRITDEDTFQFTLPEILQTRAEHTPDETAYIFLRDGEDDEERITYRELDDTARTIAQRLIESNLKGERALMLFPPGLEFVKALFGCFYAGVIAVPAYPPRKNRSLDRIKTLVTDSGAVIILSNTDIYQLSERSFSDVKELKKLNWIIPDSLTTLSPYHLTTLPPYHLTTLPQPSDLALLQYTSGSTGQPKGVMVTHRNIMRNLEFLRQAFELNSETKSVHWLPVFHDMGLVFGVLEPLFSGYTGIIMPPVSFIQKPIRWLKAIAKYGAVLGGAPNFAYDLCVSETTEEDCSGLDLTKLRTLYNGAEPVRLQSLERFTAKFLPYGFQPENFYPTYGMAESTLILTGGSVTGKLSYLCVDKKALENNRIEIIDENNENASIHVSLGKPWIDTIIKIVNPETFENCNELEVGEIWVSGSIVAKGYWEKPKETKETFKAFIKDTNEGPFLRTGDLGFYHNSELFVTGRLKDLIIIHGRNYYPQDIELITENAHPAVRPTCSAAFSVDVDNEEKLVITAEIERTSLRDLDAEAVCDAIRQKIAEEMELTVYAIQLLRTASIFKTSSGKIQRKACKEGFLKKSLEVVGESISELLPDNGGPGDTTAYLVTIQAWLIAWIHTQLKIPMERIDMAKPITAFGLSSMKAVRLQQDFLTKYGVNFPPYLFFEKISIGQLCERAFGLITEE